MPRFIRKLLGIQPSPCEVEIRETHRRIAGICTDINALMAQIERQLATRVE